MTKHYLPLLLFLFAPAAFVVAQTPEKSLELLRAIHPNEQIYIHYDKTSYVAGETIWFKAYVLDETSPSDLSSAINIELIDDSGHVVSQKVLPVINSAAAGNFDIPIDTRQMTYVVRAYTRRMMNFGSNSFYDHRIAIYNPTTDKSSGQISFDPKIYFLPEGGNIIEGLKNTVAFKVTDNYGRPLHNEGKIVDEKMNAVAAFKDIHDGMGTFEFTPQTGKRYSAVTTINGKNITTELPASKQQGIVFRVVSESGQKYVLINKKRMTANLEPAYFAGVMENTIVFKEEIDGIKNDVKARLPLDKLPSGILQVTVFNKNDQPLAVRSLFINNNDMVENAELLLDTVSNAPHQKNIFRIALKEPAEGTYSIAVTDYDQEIDARDKENIFSRILLSNNIKDRIFNPSYYFEKKDSEHETALDLVMLTSAWKRFNWDNILANNFPPMSFVDNNYITLEATFYEAGKNTLMPNKTVRVLSSTVDTSFARMRFVTDKDAKILIPGMIFNDSINFNFFSVEDAAPVALTLNRPSLTKLFTYPAQSLAGRIYEVPSVSPNLVKNLYATASANYDKKFMALQAVKVQSDKVKNKMKEAVAKRYRNFSMDRPAFRERDFGETSLTEVAYFERNGMNAYAGYSLLNYSGQYLGNDRTFFDFGPNLAGQLGFANPGYTSGFLEFRNAPVGYYAYNIDQRRIVNNPLYSMNSIKLEGFAPTEEFFSPDYSVEPNTQPDERSTLYWDPYLETDGKNKTIGVSFYNSDNAKKFRVVVTGISANGKLVYIEKIID